MKQLTIHPLLHKFPLALLLGILLTTHLVGACNDDEMPGIVWSDTPIGFAAGDHTPMADTAVPCAASDNPSRGARYDAVWGTTDGSMMAVSAQYYDEASNTPISLMHETTVSCNGTAWTYNPVVYWPLTGTMDFYAYAPAQTDAEGNPVTGRNAKPLFHSLTTSASNYQAMLMDCHIPPSEITTIHTLGTTSNARPHDAHQQVDAMFAFRRGMVCAEQSVTQPVAFSFVHTMAALQINLSGLAFNKVPAGTTRIVVGVGRIKTGGTLAICEPEVPGDLTADVVWTLDGLEGTFYETYAVEWINTYPSISRETTGKPATPIGVSEVEWTRQWEDDATFFMPPQTIDSGIKVFVFFYDSSNHRIDYREVNTGITTLTRGQVTTIRLQ